MMTDCLVGNDTELESAVAAEHARVIICEGTVIRCEARGNITLLIDGPGQADLQFPASSSVNVIRTGRAGVGVATYERSTPQFQILGRAEVTARCYGVSAPDFQGGQYARLLLDAFDASSPRITAHDFASYTAFGRDQSRPHRSDWPSGHVRRS